MGRGPAITVQDVVNVIGYAVADPLKTPTAIAPLVGRDNETVRKLMGQYDGVIQAYREFKSREIIEDIDCVRRGYLAQMADPEVITKCTGPQAAVVYGILTEKMLLESGRPTSINLGVQVDVQVPDVLGKLQRVLQARQHTISSSKVDNNRSK